MKSTQSNQSSKFSWLTVPTRYTFWVVTFTIAMVVAATLGAKNLYFRGDYDIFFNDNNVQLKAFEEIEATFTKSDNLVIVMAPSQGDIFQPPFLGLIQKITEDAWQIPYSTRVDSLANYQHTEAFEDDLLVEDLLLDEYPLDQARIDKVKQIAMSEPVLLHSLVSEKGDVTVVNVTLKLPEIDETAEVQEVIQHVHQLVDKYQSQYSDVEFHLAGIVAMNSAFMESAQADSSTLVPTMLLVVLVFLTLMLRSFFAVLATLLIIIFSVTATMGLSGWAGMFLSTATVNIPTLVMTLAVADCVHVIATMRYNLQQGHSKAYAIDQSVSINYMPILITSVTTAIGFLMMNVSDSPILRDFGNLAALGVMIACFLSLTLLPALLKWLPMSVKPDQQTTSNRFIDGLGDLVIKYRNALLPLSVVVIVVSAGLIPLNKVNDESVKYFDTRNDFRQAADFMEERISGMSNINIVVKSNESQGIADPAFLNTVGEFTKWLRDQPETDHVASLSDVYKRLNKNMHGDQPGYYLLPQDRELAAQYLLMYEMSLPYGLDLNNQVNIDKSSVRMVVTTQNLGSVEMIDLEDRIYEWFNSYAPQYDVLASSPSLMFAHIARPTWLAC